jgi:hypothetical protein
MVLSPDTPETSRRGRELLELPRSFPANKTRTRRPGERGVKDGSDESAFCFFFGSPFFPAFFIFTLACHKARLLGKSGQVRTRSRGIKVWGRCKPWLESTSTPAIFGASTHGDLLVAEATCRLDGPGPDGQTPHFLFLVLPLLYRREWTKFARSEETWSSPFLTHSCTCAASMPDVASQDLTNWGRVRSFFCPYPSASSSLPARPFRGLHGIRSISLVGGGR